MCFSATASFGLASMLTVSGAYCLHRAIKRKREFIPLAIIPIGFGIQQALEGGVWLARNHADTRLVQPLAAGFLAFALIFWPVWIPFSASLIEKRPSPRRLLRYTTVGSLLIHLAIYAPLLTGSQPIGVTVVHHSLHYSLAETPLFALAAQHPPLYDILLIASQLAYVALVSTPLLASSERRLAHFGVAVLLSAFVSHIFFAYAFESVWCYFAAAMAIYLMMVFRRLPVPHYYKEPIPRVV